MLGLKDNICLIGLGFCYRFFVFGCVGSLASDE